VFFFALLTDFPRLSLLKVMLLAKGFIELIAFGLLRFQLFWLGFIKGTQGFFFHYSIVSRSLNSFTVFVDTGLTPRAFFLGTEVFFVHLSFVCV